MLMYFWFLKGRNNPFSCTSLFLGDITENKSCQDLINIIIYMILIITLFFLVNVHYYLCYSRKTEIVQVEEKNSGESKSLLEYSLGLTKG